MAKALRAYDSKVLLDHYLILAQMLEKIVVAMKAAETEDLNSMPASVIPTETLYNISVCYQVMYDELEKSSLLSNGHAKPLNTLH